MADTLFTFIQLGGISCGAVLGYKNGHFIRDYVKNNPKINVYIEPFLKKKSTYITTNTFYSLIGGGMGMIVGRYFWPVIVPYFIYSLDI